MKPPARAIVGNLVWSTDGGVWAVWRAFPFPLAHTAVADKLGVHSRIRGLLVSLPTDSMLLSICERMDPLEVVARMADDVDLDDRPAWAQVCEATYSWLGGVALHQRRYYIAVALPSARRPWLDVLREATGHVNTTLGMGPRPIAPSEVELRRRQARELEVRLAQHVSLSPVSAGELCWLYARALRREANEPAFDESWEPPVGSGGSAGPVHPDAAERLRPRGVLAHLTDALVKEGGDVSDADRPRHRRYVRVEFADSSAYQTVLAMSDMPHYFRFPGGGGEWLYYADDAGFPVDWCVRIRSVPNADAQVKVRRKHRDLVGQIEEYDGELTGAPPQLAEAIQAIEDERTSLGSNPAEPEMQVTVLLSVAAPTLAELEDRASALTAMFEPQEYGLARPTGGQVALLRSMLPGTAAPPVSRDYTQFMLARDLAAGSPFCGPEVGDPGGLLLGVSLDGGNATPVLFDPAYGPQVNASPSLAAVGRLGSGKSFFLKRLCWDTIARGGQVVTIDRTRRGEYVAFAEAVPGRVQLVRLEAGADVCLDPLRTFAGDERATVTLGFLSLLGGCSTHSDEGAALAEAVDAVAERPDAALVDVIDELQRMAAADPGHPDLAARGLARRLAHYHRSPTGQLAFGTGSPMSLDADFIVFWAPELALPDRETLDSEHRNRMMLPEQVLGQALLYLVAAVGRQVVFRDPSRFAAALYDEAWALLASPYGQNLLVEGVRDGRKHNGAIWLASQHPNDFAISELEDLLGSRFVFNQARSAVPAAMRFLGVADSVDAAVTLEHGLGSGLCLYRDVRDRVGLIQILPPAADGVASTFETTPTADERKGAGDERALGEPDEVKELGAPEVAGALGAPEVPARAPGELDPGDVRPELMPTASSELPAGPAPRPEEATEPVPSRYGADPVPLPAPTGEGAGGLEEGAAARTRARRRRRSTPLAQLLAEQEET